MSYDTLARPYAWIERAVFGGTLQQARTRFVPHLPPIRRALLVGEGDGRFLEAFRAQHASADVTVLDASAGMLERVRDRTDDDPRVEYLRADARDAALAKDAYDLVVTHFFFDGFDAAGQRALAHHLAAACTSGAFWLLAEFVPPSPGWRGLRTRAWLAAMYAFFRGCTEIEARRLVAHPPALEEAGFSCTFREEACRGLATTELWQRNTTAWFC